MSENDGEALAQLEALLRDSTPELDAQGFWTPKGGLDWSAPVLLRRLRWRRDLSQRELAARTGIAQSHNSKAESGADVRWSTIERLIEALECRATIRVRPVAPFPKWG